MKSITSLIILFFFTLIGFCQELKRQKSPKRDDDDPEVFNVTKNTELMAVGVYWYTQLKYRNYKELTKDVEKEASLKMWSKDETDKRKNELPAGGFVEIFIKRRSIDQANTKWFTIIGKDKNEVEIFRQKLDTKTPNYQAESPSKPSYYWNIGLATITNKIEGDIFVYVIDEINQIRFEYIIKPES